MHSSNESLVNFAYGSNMLRARMFARVPSARVLGTASLSGYALKWHKSSIDGSAKCDVVADSSPGAVVHGVLYEIPLSEKGALDRAEGVGYGYEETNVQVEFNGENVLAHVYKASSLNASLLPYSWYKALVLAGARQHALPPEYVSALDAAPTTQDQDVERHRTNTKLSENGT